MNEWKSLSKGDKPPIEQTVLLKNKYGIISGYYLPEEVHDTLEGKEYYGPVWFCMDEYEFEIEYYENENRDILLRSDSFDEWMLMPEGWFKDWENQTK